jgi:hypothetical protein
MGKIKARIDAAAYRVAPKSVKKKMDATLNYKTSKNMESYYTGAARARRAAGDHEGSEIFEKGRRQESSNPARKGISPKKARRIDSSRDLSKSMTDSYNFAKEYYGNPNLSPKQF